MTFWQFTPAFNVAPLSANTLLLPLTTTCRTFDSGPVLHSHDTACAQDRRSIADMVSLP